MHSQQGQQGPQGPVLGAKIAADQQALQRLLVVSCKLKHPMQAHVCFMKLKLAPPKCSARR